MRSSEGQRRNAQKQDRLRCVHHDSICVQIQQCDSKRVDKFPSKSQRKRLSQIYQKHKPNNSKTHPISINPNPRTDGTLLPHLSLLLLTRCKLPRTTYNSGATASFKHGPGEAPVRHVDNQTETLSPFCRLFFAWQLHSLVAFFYFLKCCWYPLVDC